MEQQLSQTLINELGKFDTIRGVELQQAIVEWLDENVAYYNWTGLYFMNDEKQQLEIGPYVGAYTDHTVIPYGRGICGQVAVSGQTFEVPDVHAQDNSSLQLGNQEEIVVPIYKGEKLVGQIEIDSHELDLYSRRSRTFRSSGQFCRGPS